MKEKLPFKSTVSCHLVFLSLVLVQIFQRIQTSGHGFNLKLERTPSAEYLD